MAPLFLFIIFTESSYSMSSIMTRSCVFRIYNHGQYFELRGDINPALLLRTLLVGVTA